MTQDDNIVLCNCPTQILMRFFPSKFWFWLLKSDYLLTPESVKKMITCTLTANILQSLVTLSNNNKLVCSQDIYTEA